MQLAKNNEPLKSTLKVYCRHLFQTVTEIFLS